MLYPVNLDLSGRLIIVVGGGTVAERKVAGLLAADASVSVRVIAPQMTERLHAFAADERIDWRNERYIRGSLEGAFLVYAATDSPAINAEIAAEANACGSLVNVIDDPHASSFQVPSMLRRGDFLLTRNGLLNVLDLEDYLRGVLPAEVGAKWPQEALRVQAIISRTYVLRQSLNRSARGYDVTDSVSDQVYRGAGVETARTNQAVQSTRGEVLIYGKDLAFTPFHSDSGGHTANNADVWGRVLPYLGGVPEPRDYQSPNASWMARIPRARVEAALAKIGGGVGTLSEIRIAGVDKGGRATALTFIGPGGSKTVKSSLFRMAVGPNLLKSTMLTSGSGPISSPVPKRPSPPVPSLVDSVALPEVKESDWVPDASGSTDGGLPRVPVPTSNEPLSLAQEKRLTSMTADGVFTTAELIDMLTNPNKKKGYLYLGFQRKGKGKPAPQPAANPPRKAVVPPAPVPARPSPPPLSGGGAIAREGDVFIFRGRGWGHGVGLSQWGALALAGEGWTAERILEHYYPGTHVKSSR